MKFIIPIRLESLVNKHQHWAVKARRAKAQRSAACLMTPAGIKAPCTVKITRIAPRKLDDDNLTISGKHVRDGIADKIGVDDGSDLIKWEYDQRRGKPKEYACEVEITSG